MALDIREAIASLPLHSQTPVKWAERVLADPITLLIDHAFLEKKAANNAMELMTRWPDDWTPGWVETMAAIARDEAAHLAQVTRLLMKRGGRLSRVHKNPYANALRLLVRKGGAGEIVDRLLVAALIELRSCERFGLLAIASSDAELRTLYKGLFASERGHYRVFLKLAHQVAPNKDVEARWEEMLAAEARVLEEQVEVVGIHSG
ncbi:MAG TPA: tRNA-(ms[2]io[6]A)-hydroxylase [Bryobacteraceae bacterium]|nr:tRNA-(ms[2]io[6]A)-hydroxylase [Bryobacteraceae bacterium]